MLRQTIRSLARNPRFTVLAILTLALGIGANTAMFSLFHHLLLRPCRCPSRNNWSIFRRRARAATSVRYTERLLRLGAEAVPR